MRIPYPWEDAVNPLDVNNGPMREIYAIPGNRPEASGVRSEHDGVRDTRASQAARMLEHTDGSPAAREWVAEKTGIAASAWDRGVNTGSISRT